MVWSSLLLYIAGKEKELRNIEDKLEIQKYELYCETNNISRGVISAKKRAEKIEKKIAELQSKLDNLNRILAEPDILGQMYVDTLPASRTIITLDRVENGGYRMERIPDLSRFFQLKTLYMSYQENLVEGFDRLPTTLTRLSIFKAKSNPGAEWLSRLVNLRFLDISRNDLVRTLPDLSRLCHLNELHIRRMSAFTALPNLPTSIKYCSISEIPDKYLTSKEWKIQTWKQRANQDTTIMLEGTVVKQWIDRVNRVNKFDAIRDELLSTTAKIVLNPKRIDRLLKESGLDISDYDAILDAYELQPRQKYYHH